MDTGSYAKALDTVGWFLGEGGWSKVQPLLEQKMRENHLIGLGFTMHDGSYYKIRFDECPPIALGRPTDND